ncbi:hypothetical protein BCV70DRAFT_201051 [Testicularia cyperi]|uniref:Uncharacterized protein n=1 Tax=Testicularia cyperi TaxID=1882483 RepID=A0A317XNU6_9BASI|nr:hypothetical protein BCV70DRAFT_201051 [Testicularia cyperi]
MLFSPVVSALAFVLLATQAVAPIVLLEELMPRGLLEIDWPGIQPGHMHVIEKLSHYNPYYEEDLLIHLENNERVNPVEKLREAAAARGFIWSQGEYAISKFLPDEPNRVGWIMRIKEHQLGFAYWKKAGDGAMSLLTTTKAKNVPLAASQLLPDIHHL